MAIVIPSGTSSNCADKMGDQVSMKIQIQTDSNPQENSFKLFLQKKGVWKEKKFKRGLKGNHLNTYEMCTFRRRCLRFEMYDTIGDGITEGYFTIYVDDDTVAHSEFNNGDEVVKFGVNCESETSVPSITSGPAASPLSISNERSNYCAAKTGKQVPFKILIKTDSKPQENSFKLLIHRKGDWMEKRINKALQSNSLNEYNGCLFDKRCFRFEMYDTVGDGITGGYYTIYFDDEKVAYSEFNNGNEVVQFGANCKNVRSLSSPPLATPSPSVMPNTSNEPTSICATRPGNQVPLSIVIQTDSEISFKLSVKKAEGWTERLARSTLQTNNRYDVCIFHNRCFKFELDDTVSDAVITKGYYMIYFDGAKVADFNLNNGDDVFEMNCSLI